MSQITNAQQRGAESQYEQDPLAIAVLMALNNAEYEFQRPSPLACCDGIKIGGWAVILGQNSAIPRHFGRYGNCSPLARCVGCENICPAEDRIVDLSVREGGLSVLWIEPHDVSKPQLSIHITTFVPGRPGQSDIWTPTLCPITHRLQLVATDRARMASLNADGRLTTAAIVPDVKNVALGHIMFNMTRALIASGAPEPAQPCSASAGA